MELAHDAEGAPFVVRYAHGDFVRLVRNEPGAFGAGRVGDWGRIERIHRFGTVTVQVGGFSRPRTAEVTRLTEVPEWVLAPCDRHGNLIALHRIRTQRRAPAPPPHRSRRWLWATLGVVLTALALILVPLRPPPW